MFEVPVKGTGDLTKKLQPSSQNKASGIQILMKWTKAVINDDTLCHYSNQSFQV